MKLAGVRTEVTWSTV